jgi:hypothetical protein
MLGRISPNQPGPLLPWFWSSFATANGLSERDYLAVINWRDGLRAPVHHFSCN